MKSKSPQWSLCFFPSPTFPGFVKSTRHLREQGRFLTVLFTHSSITVCSSYCSTVNNMRWVVSNYCIFIVHARRYIPIIMSYFPQHTKPYVLHTSFCIPMNLLRLYWTIHNMQTQHDWVNSYCTEVHTYVFQRNIPRICISMCDSPPRAWHRQSAWLSGSWLSPKIRKAHYSVIGVKSAAEAANAKTVLICAVSLLRKGQLDLFEANWRVVIRLCMDSSIL